MFKSVFYAEISSNGEKKHVLLPLVAGSVIQKYIAVKDLCSNHFIQKLSRLRYRVFFIARVDNNLKSLPLSNLFIWKIKTFTHPPMTDRYNLDLRQKRVNQFNWIQSYCKLSDLSKMAVENLKRPRDYDVYCLPCSLQRLIRDLKRSAASRCFRLHWILSHFNGYLVAHGVFD